MPLEEGENGDHTHLPLNPADPFQHPAMKGTKKGAPGSPWASFESLGLVKLDFTRAGVCWQQLLLFIGFLVATQIRDWIISFTMKQNTDLFNECKWSFAS